MASPLEIKRIDLLRLAELEKRRAYEGIDTPPQVLIEAAELRAKYPEEAVAVSANEGGSDKRLWNEVDFIRAMLTSVMREVAADKEDRKPRQMVQTVWMAGLTVAAVMNLYFLWLIVQRVFT